MIGSSSPPNGPQLVVAHSADRTGAAFDLTVVIPAYDEAFRLPAVFTALRAVVDPRSTEVVVVDDGSTDDTVEVARRSGEWLEHLVVLEHGRNRGKGAAVRTGVAAARGQVVAFVDADNATDLSALGPMIAALGPNVGAVFGSRHAPGSTVTGAPAMRGLMGRVFNHVVQVAAGTSIRDTQCGAKVFSAPVARLAFSDTEVDGFAFDVEILRRLLAMDVGVIEYPVTWHYVHGTKVRLTTPLRMLRDIARIRLSRRPVEFRHVDAEYGPDLAAVVDPLPAHGSPTPGDRCRILLPFDEAPLDDAPSIEARLRAAGVAGRIEPPRPWPELLRTP